MFLIRKKACTRASSLLFQWRMTRTQKISSFAEIGAVRGLLTRTGPRAALVVGALASVLAANAPDDAFCLENKDLEPWQTRWRTGMIGFHLKDVHHCLVKFLPQLLDDSISAPHFSVRPVNRLTLEACPLTG